MKSVRGQSSHRPEGAPVHIETYALRNQRSATFKLEAAAQGSGAEGSRVRARVTRHDGLTFRLEVCFEGEYAATKANFTEEMYLHTGVALMKCQIESHVHKDTRMTLDVNSGLPRTEVGIPFDWTEPGSA